MRGFTTIFGMSPYDLSIPSISLSSEGEGISFVWRDAIIWTPWLLMAGAWSR